MPRILPGALVPVVAHLLQLLCDLVVGHLLYCKHPRMIFVGE
jgi:hypothetical protein